ncbi:MAG: hypothetical protein NC086_11655 [Alistipes sp.]|nr:hypothetical protein [Alistipes sp.]
MNFETLKHFRDDYDFDEIQVIGKDIDLDGEPFHIAAMARKGREAKLFLLKRCQSFDEMNKETKISGNAANRERMKASLDGGAGSLFLREIFQGAHRITFRSSSIGNIENGDYVQGYVLFMRLMDAGWEPGERSFLRETDWKNIALAEVVLADETDRLADFGLWEKDVPVMGTTSPGADSGLVSLPVLLETGREPEISFVMKDGTKAVCYINRVFAEDVWAERERQFADEEYRAKVLAHMSGEQFKEMREALDRALLQVCPKGKCLPVVEYECSVDVSLKFYAKEYLDDVPKPSTGSASVVMMNKRSEKETGKHGFRLRACVVETPVEPGEVRLEAELFSYTRIIPSREVRLF